MATAFARGSEGGSIEKLQVALGFDESDVDGVFGPTLQLAVQERQRALGLPVTGMVDPDLWKAITETEWPDMFERALGLVAGFEGHGYKLAAGNQDRAGITWGIIGFALIEGGRTAHPRKGSLHGLLTSLFASHEDLVLEAFGEERAETLRAKLALPAASLQAFGQEVSDPDTGGLKLLAPWQQSFANLGEYDAVQDEQRARARTKYFDDAVKDADAYAAAFDMHGERTLQFFFDLHVNNGHLTDDEDALAKQGLTDLIAQDPHASLTRKLEVITEVLADSRPDFERIIRQRKGTIARGFGEVGTDKYFRLDGWGIEVDAAGAGIACFAALSFEPEQKQEQLALAAGAMALHLGEPAVQLMDAGLWPRQTGVVAIEDDLGRSVSFRGLVGPPGEALVTPKAPLLVLASHLVCRAPVSLLAILGQSTPLLQAPGDPFVVGRSKRYYAGIRLTADDRLLVLRQRNRGTSRNDRVVDITEVRSALGACDMLMLFTGFGIPYQSLPGSAPRWLDWLRAVGAKPIVLGWYGNVRLPQDAHQQFVSETFLGSVAALSVGQDLHAICAAYPQQIVQLWGRACHGAFAMGRQRYLWQDEAVPGIELTQSGAAAITPDDQVWVANPAFDGISAEPAMTRWPPP
ncbi:peptidoglycan-binding domain-containing protein [Ideonella sp. YS5]|uniref:peptidoglycan-binding domain-containing protein n=1 Tax=Ideonella sp. YS5 TaxID=3453714 RepID=UPI003EEFC748